MTQAALIAFAVCFGVGPALCAAVLHLPDRPMSLIGLAVTVIALTLVALRLQAVGAVLPSLVAIWLAWVLGIALAGLAIRRRADTLRARRWITVSALLATTLPWFGFATADLMV